MSVPFCPTPTSAVLPTASTPARRLLSGWSPPSRSCGSMCPLLPSYLLHQARHPDDTMHVGCGALGSPGRCVRPLQVRRLACCHGMAGTAMASPHNSDKRWSVSIAAARGAEHVWRPHSCGHLSNDVDFIVESLSDLLGSAERAMKWLLDFG